MRSGIGILVVLALTTGPAGAAELEQLWTLEGLFSPESVALGPDGTTLYVSNVGGATEPNDGDGFISRVSLDGEVLEQRWAEGLNDPKGIAIVGNRLFVSDVDALLEIDLASSEIVARTDVPGARFLNDTVIAPDGAILVSDSGGARIYRIAEGEVTTFAEGDWLGGANGLLYEDERLLVSTMDTHGLYALEPGETEPRLIASGLGEADGIAILGGDEYLASEWPGRLFYVAADGSVETILDTREEGVLLNDFLLIGDLLLIPNWEPSTLTAYRVHR